MSLKMSVAPQAPCIFSVTVCARLMLGIATVPAPTTAVAPAAFRKRRRGEAAAGIGAWLLHDRLPVYPGCCPVADMMSHTLPTHQPLSSSRPQRGLPAGRMPVEIAPAEIASCAALLRRAEIPPMGDRLATTAVHPAWEARNGA